MQFNLNAPVRPGCVYLRPVTLKTAPPQAATNNMKYSQLIGFIAVLALAGICFMPWVYIASQNITVTGFHSTGTSFGKPGLMSISLGTVSAILFIVPKIAAKRVNFFVATFNFAWSIKNYIVMTSCFAGDCPDKSPGIFLQLAVSLVIMVMTFLPKIDLPKQK